MIGVFDSGLGGLTILKAFLTKLPGYDYTYLGDNARTPYGNKSQGVIYTYTRQAVEFLFARGCTLVILACNTASAKALRRIQQEFLPAKFPARRVLGVVIPLAEAGVDASRYGRIGVIGTRATIESGVYEQELAKLRPDIKVFGQACPLLVPLVEEDWIGKPETHMILKKYLYRIKRKKIDSLILGCTHYPFLQKDIERIMGRNCRVLNGPDTVSDKLIDYLSRHPEIEERLGRTGIVNFCTTDDPVRFRLMGQKFLCHNIPDVEQAVFENQE
ncbi:MAG TPA: glutamate racemase [Desulfobacteraceae bacterium]|nr:glutamate racemase [Desulfobacteraceae bacterium]